MKNKVGETRIMNCGEEAELIKYNGYNDVLIKFKTSGEIIKCQYGQFKNGKVKSHFVPTVLGVGIVGLEATRDESGEIIRSYSIWRSVLGRCYYDKKRINIPTYKDCKVCDEWLYYKNFKEWYDENYYEIEGQKMTLDKDILVKGNKIYSPKTCVFVPEVINLLFTKNNKNRGDLPIGVDWFKRDNMYRAQYRFYDKNKKISKSKHIGLYNTPEDAFNAYKIAKEENIKQVADSYKDKIPKKLYKAMYSYEVEITD